MPLIEDAEYDQYQQMKARYPTAAAFEKAWSEILADPDLRPQAQRIFKKKFPQVSIPEIDAADAAAKPILEDVAAIKKEFADFREAAEKRESEREERDRQRSATSTINAEREKLRADGWDAEGIEKIEAVMQEHNIGNYKIAAEYVKSTLPKTAPLAASYEGRDLNWFKPEEDAPDHKLLMDDPKKFKSDMVRKFMNDKANGNLAGWAA
jgi:hypothetical protein